MKRIKNYAIAACLSVGLYGAVSAGGMAMANDAGVSVLDASAAAGLEEAQAKEVFEGQPAPNPDEVQSDGEAIREAGTLYQLVTDKSWLPVVGTVLMLLVYIVRRFVFGSVAWFQSQLGGAVLAFGLSAVVVLAVGLQSAEFSAAMVGDAIATGLAAAGAWHSRKLLLPGAATPP